MDRPPRTVTAPLSGRSVRQPLCRAIVNGEAIDLFNVTPNHLRSYDAQLTGVENGCVSTFMVKGRLGRYETTIITRIEDLFRGQPPAQESAA